MLEKKKSKQTMKKKLFPDTAAEKKNMNVPPKKRGRMKKVIESDLSFSPSITDASFESRNSDLESFGSIEGIKEEYTSLQDSEFTFIDYDLVKYVLNSTSEIPSSSKTFNSVVHYAGQIKAQNGQLFNIYFF